MMKMESPTGPVQPQQVKDEISYPATRMMSIADLLELNLLEPIQTRSFKTPAERKEMPPPPVDYSFTAPDRAPPTMLPPAQFNFPNPNFAASNMHYHHLNNMAPPFYDMHYYAGPPITAYGGLPPMNFNGGAHMTPVYNPPIDTNAVLAKTFSAAEIEKSFAKKEKKRRATLKRPKFHPYEN